MKRRQENREYRVDHRRSGRRRTPARWTFDRLEERQMLDAALGSEIVGVEEAQFADVSPMELAFGSRPATVNADTARIATTTLLLDNYDSQGTLVTFTVQVTPASGDVAPTGSVVLNIDGVYRPPVPLVLGSDGIATVKIYPTGIPVGDHTVFASYRGGSRDGSYFAVSVSPTAVKPIGSQSIKLPWSLQVTPNPATAGDTLTLKMALDEYGDWFLPSGTVTFYDGERVLGSAPVTGDQYGIPYYTAMGGGNYLTPGDNPLWPTGFVTYTRGSASMNIPVASIGGGVHKFTAVYSGDTAYAPRTSSTSVTVYAPPLPDGGSTPVTPPSDPTAGPQVVAVERFGYHMMPTSIVVQFDGSLDLSRAQDLSNYHITNAHGRPIRLRSVIYDDAAHTVTLSPGQRLNVHRPYHLTINGATGDAVAGLSGQLLDGDADGTPGGNYTTRIDRHSLVHRPRPSTLAHHPVRLLAHHPRPIRQAGHRIH